MTPHRVAYKTITLNDGKPINLAYWCDATSVHVAAFDDTGKRVSAATYSAVVEIADAVSEAFRQSLIEALVRTLEGDLTSNPELHYVP